MLLLLFITLTSYQSMRGRKSTRLGHSFHTVSDPPPRPARGTVLYLSAKVERVGQGFLSLLFSAFFYTQF